ncbi:CD209 antigen-like protein E [Xyrichtys novacula]|uniref:CD209 antigen-like protein E n=1 Tax=Xyrichtys novacula TaxID=13765 RepID=A0AAV1FD98_XYRNO|nr:CD209 antigen-like protein E [Xyrichtys novacula]
MDPMEIDDGIHTKWDLMKEGLITGDLQKRKSPYRCLSVGLGLLCAVLLLGNVAQLIYCKSSGALTTETEKFEARLSNLTTKKDQLQQNYNSLKEERDRLQMNNTDTRKNYDDLRREKDDLQTKFSTLTANRDELQRKYSSLTLDKDQLQLRLNNLTLDKNHLQTRYNSLWINNTALQTQFSDLQRENDQLKTNYSNLTTVKDQLQQELNSLKSPCREGGWKKFGTSCYYASSTKKNWWSSRTDCTSKGADLVIINSEEEKVFVSELVTPGANTWIGLTDDVTEGTWMWVDGTPATTTYWEDGQPNSMGGNQDCGEMVQRGEWNDDKCTVENIYICETSL